MTEEETYILLIYLSVLLALLWAGFNAIAITRISIRKINVADSNNEESSLVNSEKLNTVKSIGDKISRGANAFLFQEYAIMLVFIVLFGGIILVIVDIYGHANHEFRCYATVAYVVGALASMLCGLVGMRIAVAANYRTTFKAMLINKDFLV